MFTPTSDEVHRLHADLCAALSDPRRLHVLYLLAKGGLTVNQITHHLGISQPATSRHLKVLRSRGLVRARRQGQSVVYTLADRRVIVALDMLRQVLADHLQHRVDVLSETSSIFSS